MARSLDGDAPIVLLDATTGRRHPYRAELDSRAPDDGHPLLFVRPAENLREGHRYVVAIRDVVDRSGAAIGPADVFRAYRDRLGTDSSRRSATCRRSGPSPTGSSSRWSTSCSSGG